MKVSNIRFGFATNSSSVHSIVMIKPELKMYDNIDNELEFGWDEWIATSEKLKRNYLAITLYDKLVSQMGHDIATAVARDWVGVGLPKEDNGFYVDHQSVMDLPNDYETKNISEEFFKELLSYYLKPNIAIVGGNDNDDEEFRKYSSDIRINHKLPTDVWENRICRKDGDWWILFNKKTGLKIRLSFNDNLKSESYTKSSTPELVDLKITDFCPMNCPYCYQDSSIKGKHADNSNIIRIIYALKDLKVFEVALGGGDPITHPGFLDIIKTMSYYGITPSFSTKSVGWLHDNSFVSEVAKNIGRVAFSISSIGELKNVTHCVYDTPIGKDADGYHKWGVHYALGTSEIGELPKILEISFNSGVPITLLGFKRKGRGELYPSYNYGSWIDIVSKFCSEHYFPEIGIDTCLASEYKDKILSLVSEKLITFEEGKFSMYIDAVNGLMGPSSFCNNTEMVKLNYKVYEKDLCSQIKESFSKF